MAIQVRTITEIFDDLDEYKEFCVKFGRVYDEAELYRSNSGNFMDFVKFRGKKRISNHWMRDKHK